jgi:hypothetical protein
MTDYSLTYTPGGDADPVTIALPGYRWTDRHSYSPVSMAVTETITGGKVLETYTEQTGRPITLAPMGSDIGFISRADLATLAEWAAVAGRTLTFSDGSSTWTCVFARPAITDDRPLLGFTNEANTEWWQATIHLMEIDP